MFQNLTDRLSRVVKTMRGQARLTEENTAEMLREVRLALLEADVALPVVKELIYNIKEKALGVEVIDSLSPGQALVGVVQKELTSIMGNSSAGVREAPHFGIPAINLGTRQRNRVEYETVLNVPIEPGAIKQAMHQVQTMDKRASALFGNGDSDEKFHAIVKNKSFWSVAVQKVFVDQVS
jgi:UDP-N-acetylglucosamine 2-epimerase